MGSINIHGIGREMFRYRIQIQDRKPTNKTKKMEIRNITINTDKNADYVKQIVYESIVKAMEEGRL